MKLYLAILASMLTLQVGYVTCGYELRVRVHSYLNPESRCATCTASLVNPDYRCCDNMTNAGVCTGEELCDTFFRYCIRPVGSTSVNCPFNIGTDTAFFFENTDALVSVGDTVFGSENPFLFVGQDWTGFQFFLQSMDSEVNEGRNPALIDTFAIDVTMPGGSRLEPIVYQGRFQLAQIELSFEVICTEGNFSLPNCTECMPGSSELCLSRRQAVTDGTDPPGLILPSDSSNELVALIVGGTVGGLIAVLLIIFVLIMVVIACTYKNRRDLGDKHDAKPPGPLTYGQDAPIALSRDNPIYSIADKTPTEQNSISISGTLSTITIETSIALDSEGDSNERNFDNPLYGDSTETSEEYEQCQTKANHEYAILGSQSQGELTQDAELANRHYEYVAA